MALIRRVYVEKKRGFDIAANNMLFDLRDNLGIKNIKGVRIVICYDTEGLTDANYAKCVNTVFAEPPADMLYENEIEYNPGDFAFAVKFLPGQFDQRADSAMQCIQIVTGTEGVIVDTSVVYICEGQVTEDDKAKIKAYCINPVDSIEASLSKPKTLKITASVPDDIPLITGFCDMPDADLAELYKSLGLAMSEADFFFCRDYFKDTEKREPTLTEIRVIDTYWSDHCRHTTFLTELTSITVDEGYYKPLFEDALALYMKEREDVYGEREKAVCLMDIAVMGMKALRKKGYLDDLDESEEINACSIKVDVDNNGVIEPWLVMFKNETHNHPTEIEPFGGAATCLGGAIRDPLSGRSYVYQAMRVTGSADPTVPVSQTLQGKLPQRKITTGAAHGYSAYGNQIGIATGHVVEIYDEGYKAKRMEIGAVIGAARSENVHRERPVEGDVVILVGGRTGRDGCGGATGSSKQHDETSILTCGAEVQKGNPPTERKLQRLFRNPEAALLIKRCNDFGAGGVSVAIGELADGLVIELDSVPKKYDGLNGTELAISESQERMAVVVANADAERFISLAGDENLEATVVARITGDRRLKMMWRENVLIDISRDFLDTNGAKQYVSATINAPSEVPNYTGFTGDVKSYVLSVMSSLNTASQKGLVERFDSTIGAGTVLMPFGGKYSLTPCEVMAAKIPVPHGATNTATVMSYGYNPLFTKWSPFHGAVYAVVESISKIVASGGDFRKIRLTFQEYFEKLGRDGERWGKPLAALLGAFYAQMKLCVPSIGGKDSMSGSYNDLDVPPTLVSFAVTTASCNEIISPEFKTHGNTIAVISTPYAQNNIPDFDKLKTVYDAVRKMILDKTVVSAYTVTNGGLTASLCKMALGNAIGFDVKIKLDDITPQFGSFVVEMGCGCDEAVELLQTTGVCFDIIGKTTDEKTAVINGVSITLNEIETAWLTKLETVFPTRFLQKGDTKKEDRSIKPFISAKTLKSKAAYAKPKVLIPVFPGTNCEYDTAYAFERAGAETDVFVIKNLDIKSLEQSIEILTGKIRQSQMIALPGGFSAGDEPDGSGKFIAALFRNSYVKEAVTDLLDNRDGLMLGICNGFQALIKLGLVPYGKITDIDENSPTLTFNAIGRHISVLSHTKIVSNVSPWLYNTTINDVHVIPISHGEGRFAAEKNVVDTLAKRGQIATQYVDFDGNASMDIRHNPNGSYYAIEGITSPDGRVLGKMGHSERIGKDLYKNIPGLKDQKIFEAGVNYFK